jgi:hypothetical protein
VLALRPQMPRITRFHALVAEHAPADTRFHALVAEHAPADWADLPSPKSRYRRTVNTVRVGGHPVAADQPPVVALLVATAVAVTARLGGHPDAQMHPLPGGGVHAPGQLHRRSVTCPPRGRLNGCSHQHSRRPCGLSAWQLMTIRSPGARCGRCPRSRCSRWIRAKLHRWPPPVRSAGSSPLD